MKIGKIRNGIVGGLVLLAGGCGEIMERIRPDSIQMGVVSRRMRGRFQGAKVDKNIPLRRFEFNKELDGKFGKEFGLKNAEIYLRLDQNSGRVGAEHSVFSTNVKGSFESLGFGLKYFFLESGELEPRIGVGFGGEVYRAEYDMNGSFCGFKRKTSDSFWGVGVCGEIIGEIPIDEKISITGSLGYNATKILSSSRASVNLDGVNWYVGIRIELGN